MKKVLGVLLTVLTVGVIGINLGSTTADSKASEHKVETVDSSAAYRSGIQVTKVSKQATTLINRLKKNETEKKAVEDQKKAVQDTTIVQEQPVQEQLTQEQTAPTEIPVVDVTVDETPVTSEAAPQPTTACDGRFHTNGVCDNTCVNNDGTASYGHHAGGGNGICDGSGHGNGICDGSCLNYGGQQGTGQGSGQGTGNYGHSSTHGNGHGGGHRR